MPDATLAEQLRSLGALVETVAADLVGMSALPTLGGPLGGPDAAVLDEHLGATHAALLVQHHELARTASRLATLRAPYLAAQVAALGLPPAPTGLCLALTGRAPEPWITVGFPPAKIVMSLPWGLPFPDGSARFVYFALALEHFYYAEQALAIVRDLRRVLAPDGVARIVVPDLGAYVRAYAAGDDAFFTGHRAHWEWARHMQTPMDYLQGMSGSGRGRGPGGFFDHKMGYDLPTLSHLLAAGGFTRVEARAYMQSEHPELRLDWVSHDARAAHGEQSYNLFVEASGA